MTETYIQELREIYSLIKQLEHRACHFTDKAPLLRAASEIARLIHEHYSD